MAANKFLQKLYENARKFSASQGGNITIIFALTTIPVIGLVGAAVDYSRANSAKAAMQAAVDATALMLSKDAANLTATQISDKADAYFRAQFHRSEVGSLKITPTYTTTGGAQIVVTGTGNVPTSFAKVMGFQQVAINVSSTVKWGGSRLRIALVLDTTGSMADNGKIDALKTATKNSTIAIAVRRRAERRRLRVGHPLLQGRQCRPGQLQCELDGLDGLGCQQRTMVQKEWPVQQHPKR